MPTQTQLELPPTVDWQSWYADTARSWQQGQHRLFIGPTQSGKTLLARLHARLRNYVVVFGTKPVDPSLDEYVAEGYTRIEQWPPTKKQLEPDRNGDVRLILWPKIKKRSDLRNPTIRAHYARCLDEAFIKGRWTLVVDEGLWMSRRDGLNLGMELGDICYGGASNKVTVMLIIQRPAGIPPIAWSSCTDAMVFHMGGTRDVRELASLGTVDPKSAVAAVHSLGGDDSDNEPSHQFLALPCRGGKRWSISEVDLSAVG